MNIPKDKAFTAIVSVFALIFFVGVGFCIKEFVRNGSIRDSIEKNEKALGKLSGRKTEFALTEKNLETEKSNAKVLAVAIAEKIRAVKGQGGDSAAGKVAEDANTFVSDLRQLTDKRMKALAADKIAVAEDAKFFGFSRYLQDSRTPSFPVEALPVLGAEQQMLQILSDRLVSARNEAERSLRDANLLPADKRVFLLVKGVRREASELPTKDGALTVPLQRDEIFISAADTSAATGIFRLSGAGTRGTPFPSLRRADAVDALAFQICFIAPTSVARNFLASFSADGKYPVYVRDFAVSPVAPADVEAARLQLNPAPAVPAPGESNTPAPAMDDFDIFGTAASAASSPSVVVPAAPEKFVVQAEMPSEFLVTFEYIQPVEKKSAPAEQPEGK